MLVELLRWTKGSVGFEISGRFPERFLNLAARRGISVSGAVPVNGAIVGRMSAADYLKIRSTARRAGVRLKITEKRGFPFVFRRYRHRLGLPVGALAGAALLLVLSCFVWSFRVEGAHDVSEMKILSALADHGVKIGSFKGGIDAAALRRDLLPELKELSWLSVNIIGSSVCVEVREKSPKPEIENSSQPCNIVASADGVITKINAARGFSVVEEGSGVSEGELLVSGVSEAEDGTSRFFHARAEVFANVNSVKEYKSEKSYTYYSLTENKTSRSRLYFLGAELPVTAAFSGYKSSAFDSSLSLLTLGENELPLGLRTETEYEVEPAVFSVDKSRAEAAFRAECLLYELFERADSKLQKKQISVTETGAFYSCKADYTFNENISKTVNFQVTNE